jgi:8-oxo-dGTP pyrophosphatase MutT (NUDIX family)
VTAPFRQVAEEQVFAAHLFSVARVELSDPEGQPFERFVVHHPGAVAVVAVSDEGSVTLVRQFRAAVGTDLLEIPAGTRDVDGEAPELTAQRELAEEAGLEASRVDLLVGTYNSPGYSDQRTLIYLATGLRPAPTGRTGVEERWMGTEVVALDDVDQLVADGTITDETTILGLLLARLALAR